MAHQGYNARLDDSMGARNGKKTQSMKSQKKVVDMHTVETIV